MQILHYPQVDAPSYRPDTFRIDFQEPHFQEGIEIVEWCEKMVPNSSVELFRQTVEEIEWDAKSKQRVSLGPGIDAGYVLWVTCPDPEDATLFLVCYSEHVTKIR